MSNTSVSSMRRLLLAIAALLATDGAHAAHFYVPFTNDLNSGAQTQGVWLADTDHLGNPPFQVSNQILDGAPGLNTAILDDWTYDAVHHEAIKVQPQLFVYGLAGHLFKVDLHVIAPVQQFSNGAYGELCSLTALDESPYAASKAYVQAVVEPVASLNSCASGVGTQTWLIPANAGAGTAPTVEPTNWTVVGAFTDPTDGSFVRWVVWTGNELDAYKANFVVHTTLLVGPPTGPAPGVLARIDETLYLVSSSTVGPNRTDNVYRVTPSSATLVASYAYATTAPCFGQVGGALVDAGSGLLTFAETTNTGYAVYAAPLAGGGAGQIYADSSGSECGSIAGDATSAGFVGLNEFDLTSGFLHVIGINEAGPASQTPVLLAGGVNINAAIRYTINGHLWINLTDFSGSPTQFSEVVADGNGTLLQTYSNARLGDDIWDGYFLNGNAPGVERDVVYLFSPSGGLPCNGGTLAAINPVSFASTNINGVPAGACSALAYGWLPASVGALRLSTGSVPIEINPVGGQMYMLLGPDNTGTFNNLSTLPGYPFY